MGHWFPGENADCLDKVVSEDALKKVLVHSPWRQKIPGVLRELRERVGEGSQQRLSIA